MGGRGEETTSEEVKVGQELAVHKMNVDGVYLCSITHALAGISRRRCVSLVNIDECSRVPCRASSAYAERVLPETTRVMPVTHSVSSSSPLSSHSHLLHHTPLHRCAKDCTRQGEKDLWYPPSPNKPYIDTRHRGDVRIKTCLLQP